MSERRPWKSSCAVAGSALQPQHRQGLVESSGQAVDREIVGADEAVPLSTQEHPDPGTKREGRVDTGDGVLFGEQTEMISPFCKHLDK